MGSDPGFVDGDRRPDDLSPGDGELWKTLRTVTPARLGLGRAGDALPTAALLQLDLARAAARDAVQGTLEVDDLRAGLSALGLPPAGIVRSRAADGSADRATYLSRPDLGRLPDDDDLADLRKSATGVDIALVLADGLSATALNRHGVPLVSALIAALDPTLAVAPPVLASQARVAIGDHIAAALGATTVIVLIGERPGLSSVDSVGLYLTHLPAPGVTTDAQRNCISNIRPPHGLGYAEAAVACADLITGVRELGRSGVAVKGDHGASSLSRSS